MRASVRASATAVVLALFGAACTADRPKIPRREPPPHALVVSIDRVSLRATAWTELHAWLAAAARGGAEPPDGLRRQVERYADALRDDDRDERLAAATRALAACETDACAAQALDGTPLAAPLRGALGPFEARLWIDRSAAALAGVEVARAALARPEVEPLIAVVAEDLGVAWPDAAIVDVVAEAPPPGRDALVPVVLGAGGACFARGDRRETERVHDARIIDCALVQAVLGLADRGRLAAALARLLPAADAERAFQAAVVHAVALAVTAWAPRHVSVYRRSAEAAAPRVLAWLRDGFAHHQDPDAFAARYAAALTEH